MNKQVIFNFKTNISKTNIPKELNNPFALDVPGIAKVAAKEFQTFVATESQRWAYDFHTQIGKMFGVLVVQKEDHTYAYLGTNSGKLPGNASCAKFVPSVFDDSTGDFFINKGMKELTRINNKIKTNANQDDVDELKEQRKLKSFALQQRLFKSYEFLNVLGVKKNVLEIFKDSTHGNPPSAAGECAAPKLLQYAFKERLKPIALAEFWWGSPPKSQEREHKVLYPACKNKCRPILEYMLDDRNLFEEALIEEI